MKMFKKTLPAIAAIAGLAACGGSTTTTVDNTLPLNANSTVPSDLVAVLSTLTSGEIDRTTGTFNRDDDTFDIGGLTGSYDAATGIVTLDGGGTATLGLEQDFSAAVLVEQASGTTFGVFGVPAGNIPTTGNATYNGGAEVVIADGDAIYALEGSSIVDVMFAGRAVDVTIDDLDGTMTDGGGAESAVTDVARINVNSATLTGSDFEGGLFSIASDQVGTFESGDEVVTHGGALFGPAAPEVGGTFTVDDTEVGSLLVQGVYTATRP